MRSALSAYTEPMAKTDPKITKRPTLGEMLADLNGPATTGLRNRRAKAPPVKGRPTKKKESAANADEPQG